jgi:hypothetical protein
MAELLAGVQAIALSPKDIGVLEMIVRRPAEDQREVLAEGELDLAVGLVGDTWKDRPSSRMPDKTAHPDMQINIMNSRLAQLVAQSKQRWPLAGDQLYMDLDLNEDNLPPGTRLAIGTAIIEVTNQPHTGCKKFVSRFGMDAMKFVNSDLGKQMHLRGINARVVQPGKIQVRDAVKRM